MVVRCRPQGDETIGTKLDERGWIFWIWWSKAKSDLRGGLIVLHFLQVQQVMLSHQLPFIFVLFCVTLCFSITTTFCVLASQTPHKSHSSREKRLSECRTNKKRTNRWFLASGRRTYTSQDLIFWFDNTDSSSCEWLSMLCECGLLARNDREFTSTLALTNLQVADIQQQLETEPCPYRDAQCDLCCVFARKKNHKVRRKHKRKTNPTRTRRATVEVRCHIRCSPSLMAHFSFGNLLICFSFFCLPSPCTPTHTDTHCLSLSLSSFSREPWLDLNPRND